MIYDAHELILEGISGDLRMNELGALAKGGFSVTLCDSELNYEAEGETPLEAILNAIKSKDNYDPTPYCTACGAMESKKLPLRANRRQRIISPQTHP